MTEGQPLFSVAGMRLIHWCMLGVTMLLLVCQVVISRLCNSLITLVDGFHTLFILLHVALPHPQTPRIINKPLPSLDSSASPPHASSSSAAPPPAPPAESSIESPPVDRGVSFSSSRIQPVGAFISALLLTSLCLSYFLEIISFSLEPHPVQRPLLPVVVGAVSLLHKLLLLWLNWDWLQNDASRRPKSDTYLEGNHKGPAAEETRGSRAGPGRVLDDYYGALVLSNPGTSGVPDTESQAAARQQPVRLHPASHQGHRGCEAAGGTEDLQVGKCEYRSEDPMETSKDNTCMGHRVSDSPNASNAPVYNSSHHFERTVPSRQATVIVPSFVLVVQGLCPALLALVNSLAMLLIRPQVLHRSETCGLLVYLDPLLSLLAVIMLIATAAPQVSTGAQVWTSAATGHTTTHLRFRSWTKDYECPGGAGRAQPSHLAVDRIVLRGLCPRALPCWVSSAQVC
ncbi:uncharacterized protein AB9W97_007447 isoform 2-T2 [Spinachia spinachia]